MSTATIPKKDTEWLLDYETDQMRVDGVSTGVGGRTRGESYSYELAFRDANRAPSERLAVECFDELLSLSTYAGRYELHEMIDGPPEYTPTWPTGSPSLLAHLEPMDDWTVPAPGIWGLVESIEVARAPITGRDTGSAVLDLSLTHLADGFEYETHDELRDDLENPGLY